MASSDYISREAAYQFFKDQLEEETGAYSKGRNAGLRVAMSAVMNNDAIPAADVRPVVRGKWTKELHPNVRYNQYKCSICGEFSGHDSEGWIWKPNFCPNCGADMREES